MFVLHATKKLLDRVGQPIPEPPRSTTGLGDWYATALLWRPQLGLFVNETTLLPVLVSLAPARTVIDRFRSVLPAVLAEIGCEQDFIDAELDEMQDHALDKTRNRSVLGVMNEFMFLAEVRASASPTLTIQEISLELARTPCGPLYKTFVFPEDAVLAAAGKGPR